MSARDWLANEIDMDLQGGADTDLPDEPGFDSSLAAALAESGLSDRSIDLLMELADPNAVTQVTIGGLLVTDPSIAARREALGISLAEAAREIGVSEAGYEAIERMPLRWDTVADVGRVSRYLGRLRVPRGVFLRWLASLRPSTSGLAWGYRPGAVADQPVEATPDDSAHFLAWGELLLREDTPPALPDDTGRLFGYAWSPQANADRSAQILRAAQARLLATELRDAPPQAPSDASVIAFESPSGMVYPAFQFDRDGRLPAIVAEVNALLRATTDPWGVADWWLTEDGSLGVRPVDLINGTSEEQDRLRRSARELLEDD
jgi:transcriptional regulator with XRE-family HTH domain